MKIEISLSSKFCPNLVSRFFKHTWIWFF